MANGSRTSSTISTNGSNKRLYLIDTNVLMSDPTCLFRFQEHDILIPMQVLEELDDNKRGLSEDARNAREVSRLIWMIMTAEPQTSINQGFPLAGFSNGLASGRLYVQMDTLDVRKFKRHGGKPDNMILAFALSLPEHLRSHKENLVVVTNDINVRIKALALSIKVEEYRNDRVLKDTDVLYPGYTALSTDFWAEAGANLQSQKHGHVVEYQISGPRCSELFPKQFLYGEGNDGRPLHLVVEASSLDSATLHTVPDYTIPKHRVWTINARNREQSSALHLLRDPAIEFVTIVGQAGSGKTILTLAAGLEQVEGKIYSQVTYIRATIPVGRDEGFLPGDEQQKLGPWMGAIYDNLEVLADAVHETSDWNKGVTKKNPKDMVDVRSLNFVRGRSFYGHFIILDEAQNLNQNQIRTLVTRAGPKTKIVCLGNLAQIDTPYLTPGTSGLTHAVERFKSWEHSGHITLETCERSRLTDFAVKHL